MRTKSSSGARMRLSSLLGVVALLVACDNKAHTDSTTASTTAPAQTSATSPTNPPGQQPELRSATMTPGTTLPKDGTPAPASADVKAKDPLAAADSDMKKVLEQLATLGGKPLETLSAEDARKQPTPADAVKALLGKEGKSTAPMEVGKVEDRKIPVPGGEIGIRLVTPKKADTKKPLPIVVYYHGGGFVIASNDVYDASIRGLANGANALVVAVDYRLAPEKKFPTQHDDAFAAYDWVVKNAASFGGDPKHIAIAGESAGGNLAANVSIMARDKGITLPVHELLVYPVASTSMNSKSYAEWANAEPLNKAMMGWFFDKTEASPADVRDTRLDLVNAKLTGLPPTTIILAQIDPLHDDGEALGKMMKTAGVDVDVKTYDGVTHEFFGMGAYVGDAKSAMDWGSGKLKKALEK